MFQISRARFYENIHVTKFGKKDTAGIASLLGQNFRDYREEND